MRRNNTEALPLDEQVAVEIASLKNRPDLLCFLAVLLIAIGVAEAVERFVNFIGSIFGSPISRVVNEFTTNIMLAASPIPIEGALEHIEGTLEHEYRSFSNAQ